MADKRQYLSDEDIIKQFPYGNFSISALVSADSYNETAIAEKLSSLGVEKCMLLQQCAIQISIIGAGNRSFGKIRNEDNDNVIDIITVFRDCNVLYTNDQNAKLNPEDLTPRRLVRFFRRHIKMFIETNERPSYLWVKYSDHNPDYMSICFPGSEHLVTTMEEFYYIYNTYCTVDERLGTNFKARIERVGIARGLWKWPKRIVQ